MGITNRMIREVTATLLRSLFTQTFGAHLRGSDDSFSERLLRNLTESARFHRRDANAKIGSRRHRWGLLVLVALLIVGIALVRRGRSHRAHLVSE